MRTHRMISRIHQNRPGRIVPQVTEDVAEMQKTGATNGPTSGGASVQSPIGAEVELRMGTPSTGDLVDVVKLWEGTQSKYEVWCGGQPVDDPVESRDEALSLALDHLGVSR